MGMNSIFHSRLNISQELPVFNGINPVSSQPYSTELISQSPPLLSGKYLNFQSSSLGGLHPSNAFQVISTGLTAVPCARPFPEDNGKEAQSSVLPGSSSKTGTPKRPNKYKFKTSIIVIVYGTIL
jgi:hypothetical protein